MRHARFVHQVLALTLVLATGAASLPVSAASAPAALSGRILRSATGAPLAGAVVKVALRPDSKMFDSAKTDTQGHYALSRLPSGTYDVAVEADGGLYVVGAPLALQPGEARTLGLSILQDSGNTPPPEGEPAKDEEKKDPPAEPEPEKPKAKAPAKGGFLRSPWGGALIVIGSAAVIGGVVASSDDDKKTSASPSD